MAESKQEAREISWRRLVPWTELFNGFKLTLDPNKLFLAAGGMAGIMNTMFAAVTQRIKDVGVLRLLGYSRGDVLAAFLVESLVIGLLGGAVGCAVGSLVDGVTTSSVVGGQGGGGKFIVFEYMVTPGTIAAGMLLSATMGFFGGLIPSLLAMRLTALDTLR